MSTPTLHCARSSLILCQLLSRTESLCRLVQLWCVTLAADPCTARNSLGGGGRDHQPLNRKTTAIHPPAAVVRSQAILNGGHGKAWWQEAVPAGTRVNRLAPGSEASEGKIGDTVLSAMLLAKRVRIGCMNLEQDIQGSSSRRSGAGIWHVKRMRQVRPASVSARPGGDVGSCTSGMPIRTLQ